MASDDVVIIDSKARFAPFAIFELARYRELISALTQREIKARYRQSLLGFGWAIVQPLAFMVVFNLVFSRFARVPSDGMPYPIFSYAALVPWTFLSNALNYGHHRPGQSAQHRHEDILSARSDRHVAGRRALRRLPGGGAVYWPA